ncbi:MAG: hypothetical protein M1833_001954 [Piccolia ochrophora]|nr:MAG: hypothetical protein M1833_001954 [Piccolia ochrophora]
MGQPTTHPHQPSRIDPSAQASTPPSDAANQTRRGHLNLDTFSPVNKNGSFAFDRVLKSGEVHKRTRKTKAWRKVYLVLRPNLLSIYKDDREAQLRQQIYLSDVTAVARLKDPKRDHVFGLFTPSKNFHLEALSEQDAQEWVEVIRREARMEEEEEEMLLTSPGGHSGPYHGFERRPLHSDIAAQQRAHEDRMASSSPEPMEPQSRAPTTTRDGIRIPNLDNVPPDLEHSGVEVGSYSSFSDAAPELRGSSLSLSQPDPNSSVIKNSPYRASMLASAPPERVIWQGYLHCLKGKGGVRQWKKLWAVLRPQKLAFYKNEAEYSAVLLIPLDSVVNAVEIDAISKSRRHCMQIITEDKSYRFCASDEDDLAKWLGALKSILVKIKEEKKKASN